MTAYVSSTSEPADWVFPRTGSVLAVLYKDACGKSAPDMEWQEAGKTDTFIDYLDPNTILKNGDTVQMWTMISYKSKVQTGDKYILSTKAHEEYDCLEEKHRSLVSISYDDEMGRANRVVVNSTPGQWSMVIPGSIAASEFKVACSK